jgi:microcystin-dependent protein
MADNNTTYLNLVLMDAGSHADTWGGGTTVPLPGLSGPPPYHPASLNDNFQIIDAMFPSGLTGPIGKIPRLDSLGGLSIDFGLNIGGPTQAAGLADRWVQYYTGLSTGGGASLRWSAGADNAAESGSSSSTDFAGSEYQIIGTANDGATHYIALTIQRGNPPKALFAATPSVGSAFPGDPVVTQASLPGVVASATAGMIGEVRMWAGPAGDPPSGAQGTWFLCNGRSLSTTGTYAALFAVIGTTYGSTGGSGTFNIPDIRERVVVGQSPTFGGGATSGSDNLGAKLGEGTHTLAVGEMPAHSHPLTDPGHSHTIKTASAALGSGGSAGITSIGAGGGLPSTELHTTGITEGSIGGGGSHNNIQPSIVLNYIIRVL